MDESEQADSPNCEDSDAIKKMVDTDTEDEQTIAPIN